MDSNSAPKLEPGVERKRLFWQMRLAQHLPVTPIFAQVREQRRVLHRAKAVIVLPISTLQPLERLVCVPSPGIYLGNLVRRLLGVLTDQLLERLIRLSGVTL